LNQFNSIRKSDLQNASHLAAVRGRVGPTVAPGAEMSPAPDNDDVPFMQKLLDNPFLLLFLGVMVPMVVYTVWGVYDILTLPVAK
jgi:hypothetical protein